MLLDGTKRKSTGTGTAVNLVPLGDTGIVIRLGDSINEETHKRVRQMSNYLETFPFAGMVEFVPTFTSVTVYYDPLRVLEAHAKDAEPEDRRFPYRIVCNLLKGIVSRLDDVPVESARIVVIPVCYGGEFGPDLEDVAEHNGLSVEEVIEIHTSADYPVYMLGFAPGFAYLGGMSERIATPRRKTPRLSIPSGTVGIAGQQTGVYPIATPGGWQLIGRTPLPLFLPEQMPPALLRMGDIVRFKAISRSEFEQWEGKNR
jgi:inhibitor of KinA